MNKLVAVVLVSGLAAVALAKDLPTPSTAAFSAGSVEGGGIAGPGTFSANFEAPYVLGAIEPQQGWTASGVNLPWASVSNANPNGGVQQLRTIFDPTVAAGTLRVGLTPASGALPIAPSVMSVDVFISGTGGADYDVVPQAPTQTFLTARVKFFYADYDGDLVPGDILILDDPDGPGGLGLAFIGTGVEYTVGAYKNLRVEVDPGTGAVGQGAVRYFYDGALIYTNAFGLIAGSTMEQGVVLHDNFQNAGEFGDFDNLSIAPAAAPCPGARGDANCSGAVDFFDIDPFLVALFDLPTYLAANCGGSICAVDIDCTGVVDFFDIDPFLTCLFSGCAPCAP